MSQLFPLEREPNRRDASGVSIPGITVEHFVAIIAENEGMSRGWESKDVESQQEEAAARRAAGRVIPPTPEEIRPKTERQSLELSRTRVLKDLDTATHPRRREQLRAALEYLERKLAELG